MRSPVLGSALVYARRGWLVLPCHAVESGECSCGHADCSSPGKHPRVPHGLHDATASVEIVRRWWHRWPDANVGLRTGAAGNGGAVVLDVDPGHGGEDSLLQLVTEHGELPLGPEVATGSGGRHLYFAHPGRRVPNSAGTRLGPGLDVRGDGGYVVAPPSRHVSGGRYRWARLGPLPDLPAWLVDLLTGPRHVPPPPSAPVAPPRNTSAWARAALERELESARRAPEGRRNHELNRAAFRLGQIVAGGHLPPDTVAALLEQAGLAAGLSVREVRATVASGMRAGAARPRHPVAPPESQAAT